MAATQCCGWFTAYTLVIKLCQVGCYCHSSTEHLRTVMEWNVIIQQQEHNILYRGSSWQCKMSANTQNIKYTKQNELKH